MAEKPVKVLEPGWIDVEVKINPDFLVGSDNICGDECSIIFFGDIRSPYVQGVMEERQENSPDESFADCKTLRFVYNYRKNVSNRKNMIETALGLFNEAGWLTKELVEAECYFEIVVHQPGTEVYFDETDYKLVRKIALKYFLAIM